MATFMSALLLVVSVAFAQAPAAPAATPATPAAETAPAAPAAETAPAAPAAETAPAAPAADTAPAAPAAEGIPATEVEAVEQTKEAIDAFQAGQILLGIFLLLGVAFFVVKKFVKKA